MATSKNRTQVNDGVQNEMGWTEGCLRKVQMLQLTQRVYTTCQILYHHSPEGTQDSYPDSFLTHKNVCQKLWLALWWHPVAPHVLEAHAEWCSFRLGRLAIPTAPTHTGPCSCSCTECLLSGSPPHFFLDLILSPGCFCSLLLYCPKDLLVLYCSLPSSACSPSSTFQ